MPPKKTAADSADPLVPSSTEAAVDEKTEKKSDAAALRKPAAHPSTAIMVREALKELDSRKGVSSQAIQNYIKQKYPTVDLVRLKHLVRRALKKGIETGTLVRPANSNVTTGAMGKFRLAPKVKETKPKTENTDPNVQKAAKDGAKKPKKAGATKKKEAAGEQAKSQEDSKPPKKSKKDEAAATSKAAPVKKPKAKKAAEKGDGEGASAKTKAAKTTKETKAGKVNQGKAAKADSDAPATKATGKRGKKTTE
ncbi:linker histone H1M [Pempheris klunzingeri]|uniref:linker histone H1M n=1 Tax=Pempheris klunzingeri TaxID=3127111 RepID=UPI00397F8FA1